MYSERLRSVLEGCILDDRRHNLVCHAIRLVADDDLVVSEAGEVRDERIVFKFERGDLGIIAVLNDLPDGWRVVELLVTECRYQVFHLTARQIIDRRRRSEVFCHVFRDVQGYWEAIIRFCKK